MFVINLGLFRRPEIRNKTASALYRRFPSEWEQRAPLFTSSSGLCGLCSECGAQASLLSSESFLLLEEIRTHVSHSPSALPYPGSLVPLAPAAVEGQRRLGCRGNCEFVFATQVRVDLFLSPLLPSASRRSIFLLAEIGEVSC